MTTKRLSSCIVAAGAPAHLQADADATPTARQILDTGGELLTRLYEVADDYETETIYQLLVNAGLLRVCEGCLEYVIADEPCERCEKGIPNDDPSEEVKP
jgi:hypothetical protein